MTRQVCKLIDGKFVWMNKDEERAQPRVHVISDEMPATQHPCDGKFYNSKSAFRDTTRAHGCYEVGNDKLPTKPKEEQVRRENRSSVAQALRATLEQCQSGKI